MIRMNIPSSQESISLVPGPNNSVQTMTCVEIAELTGKDHANVMRDVRSLLESLSMASDLKPCAKSTTYTGKDGRQYPTYELDKDTCLTLVLGYDPIARMRVVKRWQELERKELVNQPAIPQTLPEALRFAADMAEQRDRLAIANAANEEALKEAAPKVKALELITAGEKSITIRESAKLLGIKEERLVTWLHANGWTYRLNGKWVAKQEHIIGGRLVFKEWRHTDKKTGHETYAPYCHITPKGLAKLAEVFGAELPGMAA